MQGRYANEELGRATYDKFSSKTAVEELQPLQARYAGLATNLSNLETYTDYAVEMAANLYTVWEKANLPTRQKLQNMIHTNGLAFAPEIGLYRTGRINVIFDSISSLSNDNNNKKTGSNTAKSVKSGLVGPTGIEPVTC
ncbi:hypothetical protein E5J99_07570 [Hymenobacter elongatus]|uniref:Uncharacterized protein n=2 Tax=Hymenobacter elongatus TaxID=877208 RepID=A0A4Z0PN15_9BACT|nr:hypothetical protein E5J99_07570 [Hymenobacter elongatus]